IVVNGSYSCRYSFWSVYQYRFIQGDCQDTGSTMDSVFLEIIPSTLKVRNAAVIPTINFLDNGIPAFEFAAFSEEHTLEIWNPIGKIVSRAIIEAGETVCEMSLPPGLYFARLGDQVAKFIVSPR
ncbi:MAG TPA: T9SS type A sorting domain-containing protein, partial [Candidatus Kapabacteria bacterium]